MSDFIVFGGINMDLFAYLPRSPEEGLLQEIQEDKQKDPYLCHQKQ